MLNDDLITTLLHQSEGDSLDFKCEQYTLAGTNNTNKAELIKDILALANAWKTTDAHILIGVEESPNGGKAKVVGVTDHLNDADLQQLINSKTNRPVKFNYRAVTVDGKYIGLITILAGQDRPLYLHRDFGGLKGGTVKIRRGSSTVDATPDEIAEMGVAKLKSSQSTPRIDFEFADTTNRSRLGHAILVPSLRFLKPPPPPPPPKEITNAIELMTAVENQYRGSLQDFQSSLGMFVNQKKEPTAEDRFRWRQEKAQMFAVGFWSKNAGDQVLADVTVVIKGTKVPNVVVWDDTIHPDDEHHMPFGGGSLRLPTTSDVHFTEHGGDWTIEVVFGKLQPKSELFSGNLLYLGSLEPATLQWQAKVFSDHLSNPVEIDLQVEIEPFDADYDEDKAEELKLCRFVSFAEPLPP